MALERQTIAVPFRAGLDSKSDRLQTPVGKLQRLENGRFTKPGSIRKKFGASALPRTVAGGGEIDTGRGLASFQDELVAWDPDRMYSYDASTEKWIDKGAMVSGKISQFPVVRNVYGQTYQDGATHSSGLQLYAWEDTSGGVRYAVIDGATGQTVVASTLVSADAVKPKTLAIGNFLVLLYLDVSAPLVPLLKMATLAITSPTAALTSTTLTAGSGGDWRQIGPDLPTFDACVIPGAAVSIPDTLYVAFNNNAATALLSIYAFRAPAITTLFAGMREETGTGCVNLAIFADVSIAGPVVAVYDDAAALTVYSWEAFIGTGAQTQLSADEVAAGLSDVVSLTGCSVDPTTAGTWRVAFGVYDVADVTYNALTRLVTSTEYAFDAATTLLRSAAPAAKCFPFRGKAFFPLAYTSPLASTYFLVDENGNLVMRCLSGLAGPFVQVADAGIGNGLLPEVSAVDWDGPTEETAATYANGGFIVSGGAGLLTATIGGNPVSVTWATSDALTALALIAAINASAFAGPLVVASSFSAGVILITPRAIGTPGNAITLVASGTGLTATVPNLTGGTDPTFDPESYDVNSVRWAALVRDFLTTFPSTTETGTPTTATFTQTGVTALSWSFYSQTESYLRETLGGSLNVGGGFLTQYDGVAPVELGFHVFPELAAADIETFDTGGELGSATQATSYWWVALYSWTDNNGIIHRSAPSIPIEKTFLSGVDTGSAVIDIPTLRLTAKTGASPVIVEVYRTVGTSPGIFYLASATVVPEAGSATNAPVLNDTTVDTVQFSDEMSDADLIGNPRLYTTGGVLENSAFPPCNAMVVFQGRLFGIDSTNPNVIFYTPQVVPGTALSASDFLFLNLDPRIGGATALAVMDEKLVPFGEESVWFVVGAGPDATGAGSTYQDAQRVPGEAVGCVNPKSPLLTEQGVVFQSSKGLYLLSRALTTVYAGAEAEDIINGATITSARALPNATIFQFTLDSGVSAVFDSFVGQWGSDDPLDAVDSTIWNGAFAFIQPNGLVLAETVGEFASNGSAISLAVKTGPIRLGALAGFERVRMVEILGTYESAHTLEVSVYFDGNTSASQVVTITPRAREAWGDDETWGSGEVWGGRFRPYAWRLYLNRQKCESVQFQIRDTQSGETPGEGMSLSSLTLELGVKRGANKLPASQTFGG